MRRVLAWLRFSEIRYYFVNYSTTINIKPFVMFFNKENFISNTVNTDSLGFRHNFFNDDLKLQSDFYDHEEVSLVIGGSCVFGFGSSNDSNTISSLLTKKTNHVYLNFGATAFNSKQELILFLNFFQKFRKIKNVIIVSGVNDLYLNLSSKQDEWGDFFFKSKFDKIHNYYKNRNNIKLRFRELLSKFSNNTYKKIDIRNINFDKIEQNFKNLFSLWFALSNNYNFNIYYFLQPLASWTKKKLSDSETAIFEILDNSNDDAHQILKKISLIENHNKYNAMFAKISKKIGINFIDLNDEFKSLKSLDNSLFVDRIHLTNEGYEEISKIILNQI